MAFNLTWDAQGQKKYELGIDRVVLYPFADAGTYGDGEAWNGVTGIDESPSGGEPTALYANNKKYVELMSTEEFAATIKAYTYPDGFEECQGYKSLAAGVIVTQQTHKHFGLAYRTTVGNDTKGQEYGYKLHLVYNALAKPSSRSHSTMNNSPESEEMSWEISTTPVDINKEGYAATAHVIIDSNAVSTKVLTAIEELLYGKDATAAKLPSLDEIITLLTTNGVNTQSAAKSSKAVV